MVAGHEDDRMAKQTRNWKIAFVFASCFCKCRGNGQSRQTCDTPTREGKHSPDEKLENKMILEASTVSLQPAEKPEKDTLLKRVSARGA